MVSMVIGFFSALSGANADQVKGIAATTGSIIGLQVGGDMGRWQSLGHLSKDDVEIRTITYWASVVLDRFVSLINSLRCHVKPNESNSILASCMGFNCLIRPTDSNTPPVQIKVPASSYIGRNRRDRADSAPEIGTPQYEAGVLSTFFYCIELWKMNDQILGEM